VTRRFSTRQATATFAVTGMAIGGSAYVAASNHDPDGGSTGTTITIQRP
jgi:hypothetical protein